MQTKLTDWLIEQNPLWNTLQKMATRVILDLPTCTVVDQGYHIYVDHYDPLAAEGHYKDEYAPGKDDKFLKKFKDLVKDKKIVERDTSLSDTRYLMQISKLNERGLEKMSSFLGCDISPKKTGEDRKIEFENDDMIILHYSDASVAVFVKKDPDGRIAKILAEYDTKPNAGLTMYGKEKKGLGYIMGKKNRRYEAFLDDLKCIRETPNPDQIPDEDGIEVYPNSSDGYPQILIWGTCEFIEDYLADLKDYEPVEDTTFPDGRMRYLLKIFD